MRRRELVKKIQDDRLGVRVGRIGRDRVEHATLTGSGAVYSVAFSPDGAMLATGGDGDSARLWNTATGQQLRTLSPGGTYVFSVEFSPDGTTLATNYGYRTGDVHGVAIWNVSYLADPLLWLCSQPGGSLTPAAWKLYVPPGPSYRDVCAEHSQRNHAGKT